MLHEALPILLIAAGFLAVALWVWLAPETWKTRREMRERRRRGFDVVQNEKRGPAQP